MAKTKMLDLGRVNKDDKCCVMSSSSDTKRVHYPTLYVEGDNAEEAAGLAPYHEEVVVKVKLRNVGIEDNYEGKTSVRFEVLQIEVPETDNKKKQVKGKEAVDALMEFISSKDEDEDKD